MVGGEYMSLKNLAKMTGKSKVPHSISIDLLIALLPIIRVYEKLFTLKWPITKESLSTLKFAPKNMDCSKAITELGHKNRPLQETINDLIQWFHKNKIS